MPHVGPLTLQRRSDSAGRDAEGYHRSRRITEPSGATSQQVGVYTTRLVGGVDVCVPFEVTQEG